MSDELISIPKKDLHVLRDVGGSMRYMRNDVIVVTSWKAETIFEAAQKARELGFQVIGLSNKVTNGYRYFIFPLRPEGILPDSFRYDDRSPYIDCYSLEYSADDKNAKITASAWQ